MEKPDPNLVSDAALELGVQESVIEKELHAVNIVGIVSRMESSVYRVVFSGGTSLSTAHGLIDRFSEDVDFRLLPRRTGKPVSYDDVEGICCRVSVALEKAGYQAVKGEEDGDRRFGFKRLAFSFESGFPPTQMLRPHLQVDFTAGTAMERPRLETVSSVLVRKFGLKGGVEDVLCMSPIEIAAEKVSALTWRVLNRDVEKKPETMRHLYDIFCLGEVILDRQPWFRNLCGDLVLKDVRTRVRSGYAQDLPFAGEHVREAIHTMKSVKIHREAYSDFPMATAYGADTPDFERAIGFMEKVADLLES